MYASVTNRPAACAPMNRNTRVSVMRRLCFMLGETGVSFINMRVFFMTYVGAPTRHFGVCQTGGIGG